MMNASLKIILKIFYHFFSIHCNETSNFKNPNIITYPMKIDFNGISTCQGLFYA